MHPAGIIDEEKKTKHSDLARDAENHLMDPTKLEIKLRKENVDVAFYPMIQVGQVLCKGLSLCHGRP